MYKVLVVDDEYPFVQSMIQYDWAAWNCVLVGTALNGMEALRKCKHLQPQILITDINMPTMDGIELIDEVRKLIPDIQIILFTVYKEFEYAHKALHAGVIDYILKDLNIREHIGEAIEKAKQAYSHVQRDNPALGTSNQIVYLPSTEETDATKIILSQHFANKYGMLLSMRIAKTDLKSGITPDRIGLLLSENDLQIVLNEEESDFLIKEMSLEKGEAFLSELHKTIGDVRFVAAYSFDINGIADYFVKREENYNTINNAFYTGKLGLLSAEPALVKTSRLATGRMNDWIQKCTSCTDIDEVKSIVREAILAEAKDMQYKPSFLRKLFEKILYRMEMKYDVPVDSAEVEKIKNSFCYDELCDALIEGMDQILVKKNSHGKIVEDVIECIERKIDDPSLQLTTVADILEVSAGYLSKKLKDETGEGFQDLLIRLRMEKAVRLLRGTNKKVYEIASECGYSNYRSFVNVFQSIYHISPKQFK